MQVKKRGQILYINDALVVDIDMYHQMCKGEMGLPIDLRCTNLDKHTCYTISHFFGCNKKLIELFIINHPSFNYINSIVDGVKNHKWDKKREFDYIEEVAQVIGNLIRKHERDVLSINEEQPPNVPPQIEQQRPTGSFNDLFLADNYDDRQKEEILIELGYMVLKN